MKNLTKHGKHVNKRKREVDHEGWFNPFLFIKNYYLYQQRVFRPLKRTA
jgi:hypothetical protein